jgi:hypothetical protein
MWWNRMNPEQHYGVIALEPVRRLGETLGSARGVGHVAPLYAGRRWHAHPRARRRGVPLAARERAGRAGAAARRRLRRRGPGRGCDAAAGRRRTAQPVGLEYVLEVADQRARASRRRASTRSRCRVCRAAQRSATSCRPSRPAAGFFSGSHALARAGRRRRARDGRRPLRGAARRGQPRARRRRLDELPRHGLRPRRAAPGPAAGRRVGARAGRRPSRCACRGRSSA